MIQSKKMMLLEKKKYQKKLNYLKNKLNQKKNKTILKKKNILDRIQSLKNKNCICESKKKVITKDKFVIEQLVDKYTMIYQIDLHSFDFHDEEDKYICSRYYIENKRKYKKIKVSWPRKYYRRCVGSIGGIVFVGGALLILGFLVPGINVAEAAFIAGITSTGIASPALIGDLICLKFDEKSTLMQKIDDYENIEKFENKK